MTPLTALPSHAHPWTTLLARDDVVLHEGMLHLAAPATTPSEARTHDLLLVADALEARDVAVILVRDASDAPVLAIDAARSDLALAALRDIARSEPLYAKPKGRSPLPAHDLVLRGDRPSRVRLFRPRRVSAHLTYGIEHAVPLELWQFGEDVVRAPRANVLTRREFPRDELAFETVERHGREWRSIRHMFDPLPDEVTHDVDIVFSWVDGSSSEFQRQRAAQMSGYVVGEGDDSPARYRHVDELRYALRSVHMYAPWIRRIFIATDSPTPAWLTDHPKVTVVRSEEFFADPSVLPTHNSHAVEAQLHRIEGLAEHFLYSNDDMFFARPVAPELFFGPGGITMFTESPVRIGTGSPRGERSGHDNALRVNRELLRSRVGRVIVRDLDHCATPLRRSILYELEREFPEDFARTAASRFRSATDISVTNSLYHYYASATGRALASTRPRVAYVQTTSFDEQPKLERLARTRTVDMFCLNDGAPEEVPEDVRVGSVTQLLERLFPVPAPWENSSVSAGGESARSEETSVSAP